MMQLAIERQMNMHQPQSIQLAKSREIVPCFSCKVRGRSVCSALDTGDLDRLAAVATRRSVSKGQVFIDEGEPANDFFSITSGTVKLFKLLPNGRQQITGFATGGGFLGLAVSNGYAFSAEAIGTVHLCRFPRSKLLVLLEAFPQLEQRLLQIACNELVTAQEQMLLLGRKTARERVASFLVTQPHDTISSHHPVDRIALPMIRADIADYLGLTIETVSRMLSRFKAERRIETPSNDEVIILDRLWLDGLAAGLH